MPRPAACRTVRGSGPRKTGLSIGRPRSSTRSLIPRKETFMTMLTLKVNGRELTRDVEPSTLLVQFIRETLQLTGTHVGCDTAQCGACTVHIDGRAVKSCNMLAVQAANAEVTTIEGVAGANGELHPMQAAFREHHGLQCGFCTPGFVMNAIDIAQRHA